MSTTLPFHAGLGGPLLTAGLEEAVARLLFVAERGWALGWLRGPSGCGKSLALQLVRKELVRSGRPAISLPLDGVDGDEFWVIVAERLGGRGGMFDHGGSPRLVRDLLASAARGRAPVFTLDGIDRGGPGLGESLRTFIRIVESTGTGVTVLVASNSRLPLELSDRADLRTELFPFTAEETGELVRLRMSAVDSAVEFTAEAVAELHEATDGVASRLNRLADLALVVADAEGQDTIEAEQVRAARADLMPVRSETSSPDPVLRGDTAARLLRAGV